LRRTTWLLTAAAIVAVLAGSWLWRMRAAHPTPKFRTAQVERGAVASTVSATGTVQPVEQVEVGSQVSGTVYRLHADYNSMVREGQVLCELEPAAFRARAAQSEAAVARAEAALEDGRRQLRRAHELAGQQLVSQADLEAAQVLVQQREADLKAARAQLDAVRVDLGNTIIRAPISGVVISRSIDLGQTVAASLQAPKLFVIARDLTRMQVETRIDEADIGAVHPGLPVTFTVDAFPDNQFAGDVSVVRLEPITDQGVVTYTIVIRTQNPELKLRPGMTANVTVLIARHDSVLKVPAAALRFKLPDTGKGWAERAGGALAAGRGDEAGAAAAPRGAPGGARPGGRGAMSRGAARDAGAGEADRGHARGTAEVVVPGGRDEAVAPKPGAVYVLRAGKPVRVNVTTGLSDGTSVELVSGELQPGDAVVTGLDSAAPHAQGMAPPPGMGGPMMGRMGGGGGGRR
jgi:HlyD family secretion protein